MHALFSVILLALEFYTYIIFGVAILSWLIAFSVINLNNQLVYRAYAVLDAVTEPLLRPFRRFIPPLGGVDITPILVLLVIQGAQQYLLPLLFSPLRQLLG